MKFVVTDGMVDLTVIVGVIFGILAAGFIAYGEIQRRQNRKVHKKGATAQVRKKNGRGGRH